MIDVMNGKINIEMQSQQDELGDTNTKVGVIKVDLPFDHENQMPYMPNKA